MKSRICLQVTLESTSVSLASLQQQLTSLAQVALQNRRALDLLTAEKGGTCLFLQEECCYYINESSLVEQNINTLSHLSKDIQLCRTNNSSALDWTQSPLLSWLLPFLAPPYCCLYPPEFSPLHYKNFTKFVTRSHICSHQPKIQSNPPPRILTSPEPPRGPPC
jgi:hypothetical protein